MASIAAAPTTPTTPIAPYGTRGRVLLAMAWLWLCTPGLWMWPSGRAVLEGLFSAALLSFCLLWRVSRRIAALLLWWAGLASLGYFFAVHSAPDEYFWHALLGSHAQEAWEFATAFRPQALASIALWLLPASAALWWLWRWPTTSRAVKPLKGLRLLGWVTLLLWLLWMGVSLAKGYSVRKAVSRVERVHPLPLLGAWLDYRASAALITFVPEVAAPIQAPMVDVLVVVLGESASAQRWSLLGYEGQPTNAALLPLAKSGELISLSVLANGNNTGKTLPALFTGLALEAASHAPSYLDWAGRAGFVRFSFANQQAPGLANIALHRGSERFEKLPDGRLDEDLSPLLSKALAEVQTSKESKAGQPQLLTLHLYGSHPRVEKRYPASAAQWPDAYDNSITYTSSLLAQWIGQLQALSAQRPEARIALVYVSDHGVDFPTCGGSYTHGHTRSSYEVPLMLWANHALRQSEADWWQHWQGYAASAVNEQGLPRYHSLLFSQLLAELLGQAPLPTAQIFQKPNSTTALSLSASTCEDWGEQVRAQHPAAAP